MIIKTFEKETDIVIIGCSLDGDSDLMITDDYSGMTLNIGDKSVNIESTGFVSIVTAETAIQNMETFQEEYGDADVILLENFKGDIILSYQGKPLTADIDLNDYICHQEVVDSNGDEIDTYELDLSVPAMPYKTSSVDDMESLLAGVKLKLNRDKNIDVVIK